jgi:NADH-quinone oxidoreductase subunit L
VLHALFLIPLLPLAGFVVLASAGRRIGKPAAGYLATAMVGASFVVTVVVFAGLFIHAPADRSFTQVWFTWLPVNQLHVDIGLLADPLSMTMAVFITGVSTLIHLYSIGYMEHDEQFPKFFTYLNLFVASMLLLVLADNFLLSFLGWEGVGVCSYFLIAFWFDRPAAASAGKKAMIYNRIGDAGFLLAMFLILETTKSLDYTTVFARLGHVSEPNLVAIALLLFLGAAGKSAQLPLYPWLADAMEGPTPVSALIHAATMVTAGVYLMVRINPILHRAPDAAHVVAIVGVATAFLGGIIACTQQDIKKVLAYSTISQLGYMMLAVGVGAYVAAIFLMLTHAFYKALLFLDAGSVIHAMRDEQDLKKMGGLGRLMPVTAFTFVIAWFSIAGLPPFSGFWSKGDVLINAWAFSPALWAVGAITVVLTAYYIGREFYLVFRGDRRWEEARPTGDGHGGATASLHPHDPGWTMRVPLIVLAVAAALGGFIDLPFHPTFDFLGRWLAPVVGASLFHPDLSVQAQWALSIVDAVLVVTGILVVRGLWRSVADRPRFEPIALQRAAYIDATFDTVFARGGTELAEVAAGPVDDGVIDGAVNGVAVLVGAVASRLRRIQTGYVRNYALGIAGGLVIVLAYMLSRAW